MSTKQRYLIVSLDLQAEPGFDAFQVTFSTKDPGDIRSEYAKLAEQGLELLVFISIIKTQEATFIERWEEMFGELSTTPLGAELLEFIVTLLGIGATHAAQIQAAISLESLKRG